MQSLSKMLQTAIFQFDFSNKEYQKLQRMGLTDNAVLLTRLWIARTNK